MPTSTRLALSCHPATPGPFAHAPEVEVEHRDNGTLSLVYRLAAPLADLALPAPQPAGPADGLWQHTCFEAFIAVEGRNAYREFNFSPSGQWAVYDFSDTRQRADLPPPLELPAIALRQSAAGLELAATLPTALLPAAPAGSYCRLGLSAVLETAAGGKSYWALLHPGPQPDFHRREAFLLTLSA